MNSPYATPKISINAYLKGYHILQNMHIPSSNLGHVLNSDLNPSAGRYFPLKYLFGTCLNIFLINHSHTVHIKTFDKFAVVRLQLGGLYSVEWTTGMDYWNGLLECPLTLKLTTKIPC